MLARHGHLAAAIMLPLYYLADATITLAACASTGGEPVWQAHRSTTISARSTGALPFRRSSAACSLVNLALVALALASVASPPYSLLVSALLLAAAAAIVGWLLWTFARGKR